MIENRYDEFECDDIREAEGYASPSLEGRPFSGVPDSVIDAAEDAYVRECGELPVRDAMRLAVCRALALTTGEPDDA